MGATEFEDQRAVLAALVPEAIQEIAQIMRKPGRNAIARLNAAKAILDRGGLPALQSVAVSGGLNGEIRLTVRYVDEAAKSS